MPDKYLPLFLLWVIAVCTAFVLAERSTPALIYFVKGIAMIALIFAPMVAFKFLQERAGTKRAQEAKKGEQP